MNPEQRTHATALLGDVLRLVEELAAPGYARALAQELETNGLDALLRSNSLWGGAGSVADQVGHEKAEPGGEKRRKVENALVALGDFQIACGLTNPRTAGWVQFFRHGRK